MLIFEAVSRTSPFLIKIPSSDPLPVPAIIAVGVARPRAHGQAITRTETAILRENSKSFKIANQIKNDSKEIKITTGTNHPDTVSANFAIGAFLF